MLREFAADWRLARRSPHTLDRYTRALRTLVRVEGDVDAWETARMRAQAIRAFLRWAAEEEALDAPWWKRVPLLNVDEGAQLTATGGRRCRVFTKSRPRPVELRPIVRPQ